MPVTYGLPWSTIGPSSIRRGYAYSCGSQMPKVVVIEGEDAAPEAVRPTVAVLDGLGLDLEWVHPAVEDRDATRRAIDESATTLFGATSGPSAWALFYLRWGKGTYANVRPTRWQPGFRSPLARPQGIDLVIVRENLEDLYVGVEGDLERLRPARSPRPPPYRPLARLLSPPVRRGQQIPPWPLSVFGLCHCLG